MRAPNLQFLSILLYLSPTLSQYIPTFNKELTNLNFSSAQKANCSFTIPSNLTMTVYASTDCSDNGTKLENLKYFTSTPSKYAFQSIKLSRPGSDSERLLFYSLGPAMGTYWNEWSNPLQALYGSFPSYCGTNEANLTYQGMGDSSKQPTSCLKIADNSTLSCVMLLQLTGLCPDDRADWPILQTCGHGNASSINCATQSNMSKTLTNTTIGGTIIKAWNTTSAWKERASQELSLLANLMTQKMMAHGDCNTTAASSTGASTGVPSVSPKAADRQAVPASPKIAAASSSTAQAVNGTSSAATTSAAANSTSNSSVPVPVQNLMATGNSSVPGYLNQTTTITSTSTSTKIVATVTSNGLAPSNTSSISSTSTTTLTVTSTSYETLTSARQSTTASGGQLLQEASNGSVYLTVPASAITYSTSAPSPVNASSNASSSLVATSASSMSPSSVSVKGQVATSAPISNPSIVATTTTPMGSTTSLIAASGTFILDGYGAEIIAYDEKICDLNSGDCVENSGEIEVMDPGDRK